MADLAPLLSRLAALRVPSEAVDRSLLALLGWRPSPSEDGVCALLWGEDPSGAPVWRGHEPRPTASRTDAEALLRAAFPEAAVPADDDPIALCRTLARALADRRQGAGVR